MNVVPMKFFTRVDKIVGVLGSYGVHLPVEDVNLTIVEVLATVFKFEQRTILCRENITPAEIETIVKQRSTIMPRNTSKNIRNVGQAFAGNKPRRRNRKQGGISKNDHTGKGVAGKGISGAAGESENASSRTKDGGRKYDDKRNKGHRCQEPGDRLYDCTTHVIRATAIPHSGPGEMIGCLTIGMLSNSDAVGGREQRKDGTDK